MNATGNLCNQKDETIDHLFFKCEFSSYIWGNVLHHSNLTYRVQDWESYIRRLAIDWRGNDLHHLLCKLFLGACVYVIWGEKDAMEAPHPTCSPRRELRKILKMVRDKGSMLTSINLNHHNAKIAYKWKLLKCIFKQEQ